MKTFQNVVASFKMTSLNVFYRHYGDGDCIFEILSGDWKNHGITTNNSTRDTEIRAHNKDLVL